MCLLLLFMWGFNTGFTLLQESLEHEKTLLTPSDFVEIGELWECWAVRECWIRVLFYISYSVEALSRTCWGWSNNCILKLRLRVPGGWDELMQLGYANSKTFLSCIWFLRELFMRERFPFFIDLYSSTGLICKTSLYGNKMFFSSSKGWNWYFLCQNRCTGGT